MKNLTFAFAAFVAFVALITSASAMSNEEKLKVSKACESALLAQADVSSATCKINDDNSVSIFVHPTATATDCP